jgi:hypothetical protein
MLFLDECGLARNENARGQRREQGTRNAVVSSLAQSMHLHQPTAERDLMHVDAQPTAGWRTEDSKSYTFCGF